MRDKLFAIYLLLLITCYLLFILWIRRTSFLLEHSQRSLSVVVVSSLDRTSNLLFCDSCTSAMYRIAMPITHSTQTTAMSALDPNSSTKPKELGKSCKTANLCLQMRKPWWSWKDLIRFQSFFWEIWTEFHIVPHLVPHDSVWSSHVSPSSDFQGT